MINSDFAEVNYFGKGGGKGGENEPQTCKGVKMEIYKAVIINLITKAEQSMEIEVDEAETTENIIIRAAVDNKEIMSSSGGYFSAYQKFRDTLLAMDYGLKCSGSRINAVQSGMMSASDKIYLVEMGEKPQMKDVVSMWVYAAIDSFPDTAQQLAFFEQWSCR